MALLNISLVTQALAALISEYSKTSAPTWGLLLLFTPAAEPADRRLHRPVSLSHSKNGIYKNLPALGNDTPPVRYTPMGLNVFSYQLTARSTY